MKCQIITLYGLLLIFVIITLIGFQRFAKQEDHDEAIEFAKENGPALKQFLSNYTGRNEFRGVAAEYLVANMPGHVALDTSLLEIYRPVLKAYDTLIRYKRAMPGFDLIRTMDSLWIDRRRNAEGRVHQKPPAEDAENISTSYLARNLEQAFYVWENNPYRDSVSFQNFCKYILPYRKQSGLAVEDWRTPFIEAHFPKLSQLHPAPMQTVVDSILSYYKDYQHTYNIMPDYPYLKASDFKISKRGNCETKCWFNSMIFASIGIPVAIDYVPFWGNRNGSHSWNALVLDHGTYPFESFWEEDKWKYKELYNNKSAHQEFGEFRLPKVYRYSYATNKESPALDSDIARQDIPPIFRNTKFHDVSREYFETKDVKVTLNGARPGDRYAYLCVFNSGRWQPVQWARIEETTATFSDMGMDIVYLPAYFNNGQLIPAGAPVELRPDGSRKTYKPLVSASSVKLKRKYPMSPYKWDWSKGMIGGVFQGASNADFSDAKDLVKIDRLPQPYLDLHKVNTNERFRFVRFLFSIPLYGNLAEIKFYTLTGDSTQELKGRTVYSEKMSDKLARQVLDNNLNTYIPLFARSKDNPMRDWIGLDLGKPERITSVGICPRNDGNSVFPGLTYELFYWDGEWKSLGVKTATENEIKFSNIPQNSIFLLKCLDGGVEERIFILEGGNQIWK